MLVTIIMKVDDKVVKIPLSKPKITKVLESTDSLNLEIEGDGQGFNNSLILTGNKTVRVENCTCTLRNFSGTVTAKNSQVYIDSASCDINCECSSIDVLGSFNGKINSINSYIKIDGFFSDFKGTVNATLGTVYNGPQEFLIKDSTVITNDPLEPKLATMMADSSVIDNDKFLIKDYRSLEGLPRIEVDDKEIIRVQDRYVMVELSHGKTTRIKSKQEVFVKYDSGIVIETEDGGVIYRKH